MNTLLSPVTLKGQTIKNRIVMPPMVCFGWADDSGLITEDHLKHYEARAKAGTGLIIIEATCVTKDGRLADSQLGLWSDEHIDGLRAVASRCHKHGAKVLIQIHHAGLKTPKSVAQTALVPWDGIDTERETRSLSIDEIKAIQEAFVAAALRAEAAGLDGVEIHGCHTYLINQFMSPLTNGREDQYGGNLLNRARFGAEIVQLIREQVDERFIIGYRMGGNEPSLEDGIQIAQLLEQSGVDLLHISSGIAGDSVPTPPSDFPFGWIVYQGTEIRKHINIPVVVVCGIRTPLQAASLIENDLADFVAVGKGHLADPNWAAKAEHSLPVVPCLECRRCQWVIDGKRCPQFETPAL